MDSATHAQIIQCLAEKLRAYYIFPDVAGKICACLEKHLADGDYADITEGDFFALALTIHLQEVNHDEHLWVRWHEEPLPDEETLHNNPEWQEGQISTARLDNFGIHRVERLAGNIGYVDIRYFHRAEWGGDTVSAAMNFLAGTNALIIDLRQCTGGYPAMIALVLSYLFGEEPIHVSSIYWRDEDITQEYWTLRDVSGRRYGDKPVYVLTSRATFSAGEGFASVLQTRKRATIIGDKTDGGSHPGALYRLSPHFEAFIPIGRAFNPLDGNELEGLGVTPDISVPHEQAFLAAHAMALKTVLASLGESSSGAFAALNKEIQTALKELEANQKICPKCGYQNPLYMVKCKNCNEVFSGKP
jgi:ribosomal protein L40E